MGLCLVASMDASAPSPQTFLPIRGAGADAQTPPGRVVRGPRRAPASGQREDGAAAELRELERQLEFRHSSEPVLTRSQLVVFCALAVLWAASAASFWMWWIGRAAHGATWLFWLQTAALGYHTTLLPSFYWYFVGRMRRPVEVAAPAGMSVSMITLCVPAHESLQVIREQLEALAAVDYPHDSWVLDEGGSPDVEALAQECGVRYFTRRGVERWNQPAPPFQAKTKAGNVNAWLDHVGQLGLDYEVFVQLDVDHHPRTDYLERVLGYFSDRDVAWVQAPSVCGNLDNWTARGLAEQDLIFQGPLQMGFYGANRTPFIIGSHTSYRTVAILEIGGFQPTRAEDHLDTVVLAAYGYRGVFVPEVIAVGDGPDSFHTYLRQQFAWAHSMIQIFLRHTPRLVRRYTPGQAFQFLMCQSWYTLWSLSLAILWALPAVALIAHTPIAAVGVGQFAEYFLPLPLASTLMWCWTRRWFQPANVRLSWRAVVLEVARWPVVLWALINVIFRIKRPYMITPKGVAGRQGPRAATVYGPYLALALIPLGAVWAFRLSGGGGGVAGYYALAIINTLLALTLVATTMTLEIRARPDGLAALRAHAATLVVTLGAFALLAISTRGVWHSMISVLV
jgi:cellulose synthase (UDP-forming)